MVPNQIIPNTNTDLVLVRFAYHGQEAGDTPDLDVRDYDELAQQALHRVSSTESPILFWERLVGDDNSLLAPECIPMQAREGEPCARFECRMVFDKMTDTCYLAGQGRVFDSFRQADEYCRAYVVAAAVKGAGDARRIDVLIDGILMAIRGPDYKVPGWSEFGNPRYGDRP